MNGWERDPETVEVLGLGTFKRAARRSSEGPAGGPSRETDWASWEARVQRGDVEVTVSREEDGTPLSSGELVAAGGRVLAFLNREEQARCEVATSILDLAGAWWAARDDGKSETPLTLKKFMAFMRLDAVTMEGSGGLTVYDDDNEEVFAGHAIQASFAPQGVLMDTDIPGGAALLPL